MPTRTESAVVAVFDGTSQAHAAAAELTANAFAGDHIHIASSDAEVATISTPAIRSHQRGVDDLLQEVSGERSETKRCQYEQAVEEGKALLGVRTPMQMKDKAAEILSRHGPRDVRLENTVQHRLGMRTVPRRPRSPVITERR